MCSVRVRPIPSAPSSRAFLASSGVSAFVVAREMLISRKVRNVIIVGCDTLCEFITSGFASFKSISPNPCKPYDANRDGLTLGEACGAVVLSIDESNAEVPRVRLAGGAISNDANHISGPSRTGEGCYRCLVDVMQHCDTADINALSVHGTATPYNDEMEAIAIHRAHMQEVPILAFKGYYGHTMGAAGVLETILTMLALENGTLIGNPRYDACGTSYVLNITKEHRSLGKLPMYFIKMMSGFGGCNAAIRLSYCGYDEL